MLSMRMSFSCTAELIEVLEGEEQPSVYYLDTVGTIVLLRVISVISWLTKKKNSVRLISTAIHAC